MVFLLGILWETPNRALSWPPSSSTYLGRPSTHSLSTNTIHADKMGRPFEGQGAKKWGRLGVRERNSLANTDGVTQSISGGGGGVDEKRKDPRFSLKLDGHRFECKEAVEGEL